jgi:hypothetical protein
VRIIQKLRTIPIPRWPTHFEFQDIPLPINVCPAWQDLTVQNRIQELVLQKFRAVFVNSQHRCEHPCFVLPPRMPGA